MADKSTTSLEKVIQTAIDSSLKEVHTCLPAIVTKVTPATQLIDAQITIKRKLAGVLADLPLLVNVPIRFFKSTTFSITFPIEVGDNVMIIFSERSIDTWLTEGGVQNPFDIRKHSLSDAFALPMMYHQKDVIPNFSPTNMEIKTNSGDTKIIIKASEEIEIVTIGPAAIKSSGADVAVESTGGDVNVTASGDVNVESTGDVNVESTGANVNVTALGAATIDSPNIKLGAAAAAGVVRVGDLTGIGPGGGPHVHSLPNGSAKVLTE